MKNWTIAFLRDLWWEFQYPWPRAAIEKIRPLKISVCPENRFAECEKLYELNIPHGLPAGHLNEYSEILRSRNHLVLIVEDGETLVGTFSLTHYAGIRQASLCYVLVAPEHHRSGVGTTMVFASLALLSIKDSRLILGLTALPTSAPFYQRLGFSNVGEMKDEEGQTLQIAIMHIWRGMDEACRRWLHEAGARLDALGSAIPTMDPPPLMEKMPSRSA